MAQNTKYHWGQVWRKCAKHRSRLCGNSCISKKYTCHIETPQPKSKTTITTTTTTTSKQKEKLEPLDYSTWMDRVNKVLQWDPASTTYALAKHDVIIPQKLASNMNAMQKQAEANILWLKTKQKENEHLIKKIHKLLSKQSSAPPAPPAPSTPPTPPAPSTPPVSPTPPASPAPPSPPAPSAPPAPPLSPILPSTTSIEEPFETVVIKPLHPRTKAKAIPEPELESISQLEPIAPTSSRSSLQPVESETQAAEPIMILGESLSPTAQQEEEIEEEFVNVVPIEEMPESEEEIKWMPVITLFDFDKKVPTALLHGHCAKIPRAGQKMSARYGKIYFSENKMNSKYYIYSIVAPSKNVRLSEKEIKSIVSQLQDQLYHDIISLQGQQSPKLIAIHIVETPSQYTIAYTDDTMIIQIDILDAKNKIQIARHHTAQHTYETLEIERKPKRYVFCALKSYYDVNLDVLHQQIDNAIKKHIRDKASRVDCATFVEEMKTYVAAPMMLLQP